MNTTVSSVLTILFISATVFLSSSCSPVSTVSRIDANPAFYNGLSKEHQALVRQSQLSEGMGKEAVFLAWGKADHKKDSFSNGLKRSAWYYTKLVPHYRTHLSGGIVFGKHLRGYHSDLHIWDGYTRSPHSRHRRYFGDWGTSVYYTRKDSASVFFENDLVVGWETEH